MFNFYMLIGLPCSGKSTFVENFLLSEKEAAVLSTDNELLKYDMPYNLAYEKHYSDANQKMYDMLDEAIKNKTKTLIWDQTNLISKARMKKLGFIPETYKKIAVVFPVLDLKDFMLRNEHRKNKIDQGIFNIFRNVIDKNYMLPEVYFKDGFDEVRFLK